MTDAHQCRNKNKRKKPSLDKKFDLLYFQTKSLKLNNLENLEINKTGSEEIALNNNLENNKSPWNNVFNHKRCQNTKVFYPFALYLKMKSTICNPFRYKLVVVEKVTVCEITLLK